MKKIVVVVIVLALASLACGLQKVTPTPVPPPTAASLPTKAPLPTTAPLPTQAPAPTLPPSPNLPSQSTRTLLFEDDFSNPSNLWSMNSSEDYRREFRDGGLLMGIRPTQRDAWTGLNFNIHEDVQIEVDAVKTAGSIVSDFGVVCGMQNSDNFFALTAGPDGYVEIFKYVDGKHTEILTLHDQPALVDGPNHLKATCQGSTLTLEANGQHVATATDTSLKPGKAGVIIGTFDEGGVNYVFDNFKIYGLGTQGSSVVPPAPADTFTGGGELLFSDDFSNKNSGWDVYKNTGYTNDGSYRILIENEDWEAFGNPYRDFPDGIVAEVDATVVQGHAANGFGIICGYQNVDDFFALLVGTHGFAEIIRYTDDGRNVLKEAWNVPTNPNVNHVSVSCGNNNLVLYVNGVEALRTTHSALTGGDVGLIAGSFATTPVEVHFDNFEVRRLAQ